MIAWLFLYQWAGWTGCEHLRWRSTGSVGDSTSKICGIGGVSQKSWWRWWRGSSDDFVLFYGGGIARAVMEMETARKVAGIPRGGNRGSVNLTREAKRGRMETGCPVRGSQRPQLRCCTPQLSMNCRVQQQNTMWAWPVHGRWYQAASDCKKFRAGASLTPACWYVLIIMYW